MMRPENLDEKFIGCLISVETETGDAYKGKLTTVNPNSHSITIANACRNRVLLNRCCILNNSEIATIYVIDGPDSLDNSDNSDIIVNDFSNSAGVAVIFSFFEHSEREKVKLNRLKLKDRQEAAATTLKYMKNEMWAKRKIQLSRIDQCQVFFESNFNESIQLELLELNDQVVPPQHDPIVKVVSRLTDNFLFGVPMDCACSGKIVFDDQRELYYCTARRNGCAHETTDPRRGLFEINEKFGVKIHDAGLKMNEFADRLTTHLIEERVRYTKNEIKQTMILQSEINGELQFFMNGNTWISSWAMMDMTRLSFYTNDGADLDKPFFSIDLTKEQWALRTGQEMPVECDDSMRASNVLMIKMPRSRLYIMSPSQSARWTECLQLAQIRRLMLNSRPATFGDFSCILMLSEPKNWNIFNVRIVEDWYVFATETGLFFTSITQPRDPCRIAGPSSVTFLEIMSDINCIAMVAGAQLTFIPVDSLTLAMQSTQPSIRPQVLPEFTHVNVIRYHKQNGQRFLLVADDTPHLHIRKYDSTRNIFIHFAEIGVSEPVTFIESAPHGVLFASDTFYFATIDTESTSSNFSLCSLISTRSGDPISAQLISDKEILLSFKDYGTFVGIDGKQTRKETIKWNKKPLKLVFTSPYLYVIHDDSIEILEISEYSGRKTSMKRMEMVDCINAKIVGKQFDGVFILVNSNESVEVHRFSTFCVRKNIIKRRGVSPSNILKRSKN